MKLNILVAEDDPHTRAALCELLSNEGHQVTPAADGKEAEFRFNQHPPDLACLDVMMPGISGFDLCRLFRRTHPHLPILFITAKGEEIDKVLGLELGADDYIVKPFGGKEVLARIRAVARRCIELDEDSSPHSPLCNVDFLMGDLMIKPRSMKAVRDSVSITLTKRELIILQVLHSRPGEVIDRKTLFQQAWQDGTLHNTRTLDQTISNLRKRVERDSKAPELIQTVYGVGYRYDPPASL